MRDWDKVKLSDVSVAIQTGPFGSQLHQSDYSEIGVPVVMPKDIINGVILDFSIARVEKTHVQRLSRHVISEGDIIYPRRGDVEKCAYTKQNQAGWLCGTGCIRVTIDRKKASPKYIFYHLQESKTTGWVKNHAVGSTMLNLNTTILSNIPLSCPPLAIQHRIANILSRYDSLIANYQQQIKLLEEAAQRLYKEWFVDFRFPGHENTQIVDGVPKGWAVKTLSQMLSKDIGGGWGKDTPVGSYDIGGYVIRGTDITQIENGNLNVPYRYHTASNLKERRLCLGDVIFEVSGGSAKEPVGRTLFITSDLAMYFGENTICASFCKKMSFESIQESILSYISIRYYRKIGYLHKYEKDSAGKIINYNWTDFLNEFKVLLPDNSLLETISMKFYRIINESSKLRMQIKLLTEARDRLLPKLMSGEIEV